MSLQSIDVLHNMAIGVSCLVGVLAFVCLVSSQTENLDMMGLINILYLKVYSNLNGTISQDEMATLWDNMDLNGDGQVNLTEFTTVWENMTHYSDEITSAYFFLSDLDGNGVLNNMDTTDIFTRFDTNRDGVVQSSEFLQKFTQVYHEVPFVVLFERVDKSNNNDQHLSHQEFSQLFKSLTSAADGSVKKADFEHQWTSSRYGSMKDADDVFTNFDSDKNNVITITEVDAKFASLDVNGNGTIEILEVIALAN